MGDVIALNAFRAVATPVCSHTVKTQTKFRPHEIRTISDIRTRLIQMGFTKDPTFQFSPHPNKDHENNRLTLNIDVADTKYQKIFGEHFQITITKYLDQDNNDVFMMETPLSKSSGNYGHVIRFIENFIRKNLRPEHRLQQALVASR